MMKKELDVGPLQGEQMEQQYAPQPQQYAPQPVAPQQVNINMMQPRPQAPIIINNNNNDNNINTMQMQAPTPQQMYTHEPSTGWQSGLFECFNDFPVCCGVFWCFPCAYGMLVEMHMENKAEGHMPFGNFGACFGAFCFKAWFAPPAAHIAASVISAVYIYSTTGTIVSTIYAAPLYNPIGVIIAAGTAGSIMCCVTSRNRSSIRNKLNLKAEPCHDMIVHFCCMECAVCQECRELKATHGGSTGGNHFNRM